MDPRTRLCLLVLVGVLSVVLDRPFLLGLLAATCAGVLLALPIGWTWRRRSVMLVIAAIWSTVVSQGFFYADVPRTVAVWIGPFPLYRQGITHGLVQSLRLISTTCAGLSVAISTPPDRLFVALLALRVPFPIAFLAITALRFVPQVGRELAIVRTARRSRLGPTAARRPLAWLTGELGNLRPVVARSLRRARVLAMSLDARGFDPGITPTRSWELRMPWGERALLAVACLAVATVCAMDLLYGAYVAELYYTPALRPLYGFVRAWL